MSYPNEELEEDLLENFTTEDELSVDLTDDSLSDIEKKLPEWSIRPPHSFLK